LADWQQLPVSAIANFRPMIIAQLDEPHLKSVLDRFPYSRFPVVIAQELGGILTRAEIIAATREKRPVQLHKARTCFAQIAHSRRPEFVIGNGGFDNCPL
jgi:hypothetical protein